MRLNSPRNWISRRRWQRPTIYNPLFKSLLLNFKWILNLGWLLFIGRWKEMALCELCCNNDHYFGIIIHHDAKFETWANKSVCLLHECTYYRITYPSLHNTKVNIHRFDVKNSQILHHHGILFSFDLKVSKTMNVICLAIFKKRCLFPNKND